VPDTFAGESLVPLMQRRGEHRRVFAASRTARYGNALSSLHTQRYKVILSTGSSSPGLEVFLHEDLWEQENLVPERPALAGRLRRGLENRIQALEATRSGLSAPRRDVDLTEAQEERLRALGYIQ